MNTIGCFFSVFRLFCISTFRENNRYFSIIDFCVWKITAMCVLVLSGVVLIANR
uniref:DUF3995 domain-containing protein n=1 Tax=Heterorhabditis bacteriophora TaxID=37862 RepID=A0A1I7WD95_HETBA